MSASVDLSGRVAVVTGGVRGIGRSIAEALGRAGAELVLVDLAEQDLEKAADEIRSTGPACTWQASNVADPDSVRTAFHAILDAHGRIDILVNNAGITRDNIVLRMKGDEWSSVVGVNLSGVFHCTQAAARSMLKARSGKIVNIASVSGFRGNPGQANYAAAKGGVIALTKSCAKEFAARGVQVNAVAPGLIETDMTAKLPDEARTALLANVPVGRMGSAEEVASAVLFLASPWADYVTGHVLVVDGGLAM
jgi:3-oxoacyl-[acyl-carrier protein] reductase